MLAHLIGHSGLQKLQIDQGIIQSITPAEGSPDYLGWLSPGAVDLQINGALGLAFPDLNQANAHKLAEICEFLWQQGVDAFLPTLVTCSPTQTHSALAVISQWLAEQNLVQAPQAGTPQESIAKRAPRAQILGAHLEGPFLNPAKRGAHPEAYLLPLEVSQIQQLLAEYSSAVRLMTLAPELDPRGESIAYLRSQGITVSLGHSQADTNQAEQAFNQGATMVTHAFNAMPSLHHRQPGLLGVALTTSGIWCGCIADGVHVHPRMLALLLRVSDGLFLVSDALAPLGLPDGLYPWDERQIEVKEGTCSLPDGTLAGTTLPLLKGVQNLVRWQLCAPEAAIALATLAPRQAIGLPGLESGQPATFLHWQFEPVSGELSWQRLVL
ncbi:N-acetylglucosamine-6-phosphate deacetylase [Leptolyngbya sp. FACHB-261]|uniref:N-acetylglucosamine-6-phosphate deacetylase n=1 Tax=Leptolyngbya sp. FACHB-261 TaxID=2692806 RepID=UPI001685BFBD|nr:N-acetylglucosamine-6-phosphate deacetylase [Leptolyngbya sp. FACHB-261]MBD2099888.1 N-acetylglucosamine-6-phosphate deacetylase [Leptolyngbya sp. FACHB-261]